MSTVFKGLTRPALIRGLGVPLESIKNIGAA